MIAALSICSFFLFSYRGYDLGDKYLTNFAAVAALGVIFYPCTTDADGAYVGLFAIPLKISNILHNVSAAILFGSFTIMTMVQFPKGVIAKEQYLEITGELYF